MYSALTESTWSDHFLQMSWRLNILIFIFKTNLGYWSGDQMGSFNEKNDRSKISCTVSIPLRWLGQSSRDFKEFLLQNKFSIPLDIQSVNWLLIYLGISKREETYSKYRGSSGLQCTAILSMQTAFTVNIWKYNSFRVRTVSIKSIIYSGF